MSRTAKSLILGSAFAALAASAQAQFQSSNIQGTPVPPPTFAGAGTFDECSTPMPIMGEGSFAYDNSGATTGAEGQMESDCLFFGSTNIDNDIWFAWTADETGTATIDTCGSTIDTKISAYDGAGCPSAPSIACNDDSCGLQSEISFDVTAGTTYTLQVGNFPGAAGGAATLNVDIDGVAPSCYSIDDGVSELSIGLTAGGEVLWLQGYDAIGGSDVISGVSAAFGTPLFPGLTPGQAGNVCVWDDPTNDFNPSDAVLLFSGPIVAANEDTDILNAYPIPDVAVNGVFFVGVSMDNLAGDFPATQDTSEMSNGRAWIAGGATGTLDLVDLTNNDIPVSDVDTFGLFGIWLLDAAGENCTDDGVGTPFCSPANPNSTGASATLTATGSDAALDNDLTFLAADMPLMESGYLVNSMNIQMVNISDGLLCIGPGFGRHVAQIGNTGMTGEIATTVDLTALPRSSGPQPVLPGETWVFQFWYRDGSGASNFTNALEILFN